MKDTLNELVVAREALTRDTRYFTFIEVTSTKVYAQVSL